MAKKMHKLSPSSSREEYELTGGRTWDTALVVYHTKNLTTYALQGMGREVRLGDAEEAKRLLLTLSAAIDGVHNG